ncbi:MAG: MFS transporter [Beijerinckiaceae bacterium]|nr:MFS transporter [Beijerinckiaceae bacterium]MCZ8300194.1 MFS transporter [Beijerinckiaceae bacterium]
MRMAPESRKGIVAALGIGQTVGYASSYYLPAVLATPMAASFGVSPVWVFAAFSAAMVISALTGPWAGAHIDRLGGRGILIASNLIFAAGLGLMAASPSLPWLVAAWILMGIGMGIGLYDSAFAALAKIYGRDARSAITGITLIAGFASTVGWPLSAWLEAQYGWRMACLGWMAIHLGLALPLHLILPAGEKSQPVTAPPGEAMAVPPEVRTRDMAILAFVFAVTWFTSTAMAAHLPRMLEAAGATPVAAVAAGALIGPAQVAARVLEFVFLNRVHPLLSARLATLAHPVAAGLLIIAGGPAAAAFAFLHGAGNGVLTIAKGTLPLALFGPGGYGLRQGLLSAPARVLQAIAPLLFGILLEHSGAQAIWLTTGLGLMAFLLLMLLRARP